ncbi:DUF6597 domain-containing transcriptional factor [Kitasatospora sp. NPDC008050]|uniref:DUF6597 domain-containing transcriptional factor n=1 Tax=Kitasatospora sp. NPDC008050 TaxID=3364021 RepID=UPI0036E3D1D5
MTSATNHVSDPVDEAVRGCPAPALRPYVAWYSGYRQCGVAPMVHRGLPSPYLTLILTLDDPLTLAAHPDPRQPPGSYRTLLGGLHTRPALITHAGYQSGVQIALSPLGARVLLGLPAGELAELDFAAEDVLGGWAVEGQERLRYATDWPGRFAAVDRWLGERLGQRAAEPAPEVVRAWQLLLAGGGQPSAGELADRIGWSGRHLADRFRTEIGLTPKAAARVIRFDRARRLLTARAGQPRSSYGPAEPDGGPARSGARGAAAGGLGLADLAAHCGYFDQAHLAREFRALAGCAPSRWVADEAGALVTPAKRSAEERAARSSETSKAAPGRSAQAGGTPG